MSLEQVIKSVDKNFPLIKMSRADISEAKANLLSAQGGFDPVLSSKLISSPTGTYQNGYWNNEIKTPLSNNGNQIFSGYRIGRGNFPTYNQDRWTYNSGEVLAGIDMPILRDRNIDSRRGKLQQSHIEVLLSNEKYQLQKISVEKDAAFSYLDWVAEGEKTKIQQNLLILAQNRQNIIEERIRRGDLPKLEITDNQRLIYQRQANLEIQKQNFANAANTLSLYYRDTNGNPIIPSNNDLESLLLTYTDNAHFNSGVLNDAIYENPQVRVLDEERRILLVKLALAKNNLLPKLNNKIYLAHDMGGGNPPLNRNSINLELQFEVPLFQREANGKILAIENLLEKLSFNRRLLLEQLNVGVNSSKQEILATKKVISIVNQELKSAIKLSDAENLKYANGDSNLFQLNVREQVVAEARTKLITALLEYRKAISTYYYTLGLNQKY